MVELDEEIVDAIRSDLSETEEVVLDRVLEVGNVGELERIEDQTAHVIVYGEYPESWIEVDPDRFDEIDVGTHYWLKIADCKGIRPELDGIKHDETLDKVMQAYFVERSEQIEREQRSDRRSANESNVDDRVDDDGLDYL